MKDLILDVSKWNGAIDFAQMKAEGVQAIIVKAGGSGREDRLLRRHAAGTRSAGLYLGLYYWIDPLCDGATQARHFLRLVNELQPDFVAGDNEQWWADWDKWRLWRMGKLDAQNVPVLPPKQIERVVSDFLAWTAGNITVRLLHYTSMGFLREHCPQALN